MKKAFPSGKAFFVVRPATGALTLFAERFPALVGSETGDEGGPQADDDGDRLDHPADIGDPADEPEDDQAPEGFPDDPRVRVA